MRVQFLYENKIFLRFLFTGIIIFLPALNPLHAQEEFKPLGNAIGTVFFNYSCRFTRGEKQRSAFEVERVYLGYKYNFSKTISVRIVYDVAHDGNAYSAFVKNAGLDWNIGHKVKLSAGIITLKQFDTQEKFWGCRYLMKPFADQYGLGPSADLGLNLELPVYEKMTLNLFMLNGEGYKSLQDRFGMNRIGGNFILIPAENWIFKVYYDYMPNRHAINDSVTIDTSAISNITAFMGYELPRKFRIGIEYNQLFNGKTYKKYAENHSLGGISAFFSLNVAPNWDVLGRYDLLRSNKPGNISQVWNYNKDGSLILAGVQFVPAKGVKLALNYRTFLYRNTNLYDFSGLFLNFGLSF